MEHAENPVLHGHDWAIAAWTIIAFAAVLGISSNLTAQFLSAHGTSALPATVIAHAVKPQDTFPIILTVPFAVARTQREMVAHAQHHAEFANRLQRLKSDLKAAPGLVAGLALMGASQSSSH
jgi:hypothetical protein